jgi:hypothetical protein
MLEEQEFQVMKDVSTYLEVAIIAACCVCAVVLAVWACINPNDAMHAAKQFLSPHQ